MGWKEEKGRTDLLVYHGLVDKVLLVLRADDVEVHRDADGAVVLRRVGRRRPASNPVRAFVQLHVRVVELGTRRSGATYSLGDLLLGGDVDGQEEEDGQQRAERTEEIGSPHLVAWFL